MKQKSIKKMGGQINKRRGYAFEGEIKRGLDLIDGCTVYKVPDAKTMHTITALKSPADFVFTYNEHMFTIEAKTTKLKRLPWANFRDHQIDWVLSCPATAWFVINFHDRHKINETFLLDAPTLIELKKRYPTSVPIDKFRELCPKLERKTARFHPTESGPFINFESVL
jgi:penicillin-binding protein-related factor A (putative recombinase)